jgi:hypothetical protein
VTGIAEARLSSGNNRPGGNKRQQDGQQQNLDGPPHLPEGIYR